MDQVLQGSKMASAKWRKQRLQERQRLSQLLREQREERKSRMVRYSEVYISTDDDSSRSNSSDNESTAETPSECSARTPEHLPSPEIEIENQQQDQSQESATAIPGYNFPMTDISEKVDTSEEHEHSAYELGATLFTPADFTCHRLSTIHQEVDDAKDVLIERTEQAEIIKVTTPNLETTPHVESLEEESITDDEDDDDEDNDIEVYEVHSPPIEVAKSVLYSAPVVKPLVVSVLTIKPQTSSRKHARNNSSSTSSSLERQQSSLSVAHNPMDGFLAAEARPVQFPSLSAHERAASAVAFSMKPESPKFETEKSFKRKSSMAMLGRFAHTRVHSIKNFMKPNTSFQAPEMPKLRSPHQYRPSTAGMDRYIKPQPFSAVPSHLIESSSYAAQRSVSQPLEFCQEKPSTRPKTSHAKQSSVPILSTEFVPPRVLQYTPLIYESPKQEEMEKGDEMLMSRRKSFSNLRRRSGSLGNALKLAMLSKTPPVNPDSPVPPLPSIPSMQQDDLVMKSSTITPTPKTPRMSKFGSYSPFPRSSKQGEPIGLGLSMT